MSHFGLVWLGGRYKYLPKKIGQIWPRIAGHSFFLRALCYLQGMMTYPSLTSPHITLHHLMMLREDIGEDERRHNFVCLKLIHISEQHHEI